MCASELMDLLGFVPSDDWREANLVHACEEGEEGKVATSYADRGLLAQDGRTRFEGAVVDHGIGNPYFFLPRWFRVGGSVGGQAGEVAEDEMVGHEVQCAVEARASTQEVDILHLDSVGLVDFVNKTSFRLPYSRVSYPWWARSRVTVVTTTACDVGAQSQYSQLSKTPV